MVPRAPPPPPSPRPLVIVGRHVPAGRPSGAQLSWPRSWNEILSLPTFKLEGGARARTAFEWRLAALAHLRLAQGFQWRQLSSRPVYSPGLGIGVPHPPCRSHRHRLIVAPPLDFSAPAGRGQRAPVSRNWASASGAQRGAGCDGAPPIKSWQKEIVQRAWRPGRVPGLGPGK